MTEIPEKPACVPTMGVINCSCHGQRLGDRLNCISARYFWLDVAAILSAPTPEARKAIVESGGHRKPHAQKLLWRAARQEMSKTTEAAA
jgi:hypothetical protein